MSSTAPWIALSIDWHESDMFDDEATDGERLAWICLLCHAKAYGRGGRVRVRKSALAATYRLSMRSVEGMLARAQKCGSITIDDEAVTIVNWGTYQWKASRSGGGDSSPSPGKRTNDTTIQDNTGQDNTGQNYPPSPPEGGKGKRTRKPKSPPVEGEPTKPARPPDPIWDTVVEIFHPSGLPETARARVGQAVKDFKAKGATPDDIRTRYQHAVAEWPTVGPEGVLKHWDRLARPIVGVNGQGARSAADIRRERERADQYPIDSTPPRELV